MNKCCERPNFETKIAEKKEYVDSRKYGVDKNVIQGKLINNTMPLYIIFCKNCGHLERKGTL